MLYKIYAIILILFLSGCALIRPSEEPLHQMSWKTRQAELKKIKNWDMSGSISITQSGKTDLGTFRWQQQKKYIIELTGPMNLNTIIITGNEKNVTLQGVKNGPLIATTPEELLFKQFGWKLPISNLIYWIKATPAPTPVQNLQFDSYHHLIKLKQSRWNIEYLMFKSFNGIDLPTKIYLWNEELRIKIVIKKIIVEN